METAILKGINETAEKLSNVSLEDLQTRHRKERKELQAKIQNLKKNAPKSDKKKRKEALEEIAKLEKDLELKQKQELQAVDSANSNDDDDKIKTTITFNFKPDVANCLYDDDECGEETEYIRHYRISKAQRRRNKKSQDARQREAEIKASAEDAKYAPKAVEARKLKSKLKIRQLALHNIPSDGDCLYNAIRHQLLQQGLASLTVQELRSETANYIQANKNSLIPYMTNHKTGDLLTDEEFLNYCNDIRMTPAWGGQIELKALSCILKVPIEVIQANGSPTILGADEFGGSPLLITYHRHMLSLGEHYNSTVPLEDASDGEHSEDI